MSEEQELKQEPTPEESQAAEEAAMEAGFNSVRGTQEQPEEQPDEKPAEQEEQAPEETTEAAKEDAPQAGIANLTEAQVQELLAAANRVKGLESALHRTQSELGRVKAQLAKPAPQPEKVEELKAPELKRLREEYPNVAEALGPDIAELLAQNKGNAGDIESLVSKAVATSNEAVQRDVLEIFRPNWEQEANDAAFLAWLRTQPPEYVERATTSEKAAVVLQTFADYEHALKSQKEAADKAAAEASARKDSERKQRRLEGAIPPAGGQATRNAGMTEEQAMQAGFNRVRGTASR